MAPSATHRLALATVLALTSAARSEERSRDRVVLFSFEDSTQGWTATGKNAARVEVEQVGNAGQGALRIRHVDSTRERLRSQVRLPPHLRQLAYRSISLKYKGVSAAARFSFGLSAKDENGRESIFAARVYFSDADWQEVELRDFWSKTGYSPDLSTVAACSLTLEGDTDLLIAEIAVVPMSPITALTPDPVFFVQPTAAPPTLDGRLDDPCWGVAPSTELRLASGAAPRYPTAVRWCYDSEGLYFGIRQQMPPGQTPRRTIMHRDGPVWKDDAVEIHLDAVHAHAGVFMLAFNAAGTRFDMDTASDLAKHWDGDWQVAVEVDEGLWTAEIAVPFATLEAEPPRPGASWGINIKRFLYADSEEVVERTSLLASDLRNRSAAGHIGDLVFCAVGDQPKLIDPIELQIPTPGSFRFVLPPTHGSTRVRSALSLPGAGQPVTGQHEVEASAEPTVLVQSVKPTDKGTARFSACAMDAAAQRVLGYGAGCFPVSMPVAAKTYKDIVLWPPPQEISWTDGAFTFERTTAWCCKVDAESCACSLLLDQLRAAYGLALKQTQHRDDARIVCGLGANVGTPEGFRLEVTPERITLQGEDARGLYYGVRALLSLIEQSTPRGGVPTARTVWIRDWPEQPIRCAWMNLGWPYACAIDPQTVKDYIYRTIAGNRFNTLAVLCGTGVRYRTHPEISAPNALAMEDVADIAAFGRRHGIDMIPAGNSPGHAGWLLASHPELREDGNAVTLCTSHPDSFRLLFEVYDELCEAMPSGFFHIGHDEVRWKTAEVPEADRCKLCAGKEKRELLLQEINTLHEFFAKRDRRMLMWADMLVPAWNGAGLYQVAAIRERIPRDVTILPWGRVGDTIRPFHQLGFTVWRCNTGFNQGRINEFFADHELLSGDGIALTTKAPWLPFNHIEDQRQGNYNSIAVAVSGAGAWNTDVAKRALAQTVATYGNHIARRDANMPQSQTSGRFDTVPLGDAATMPLSGQTARGWFRATDGRDLSNVPTGPVEIAGIPFELTGAACPADPQTPPLHVGAQLHAFVVMHTVHVPTRAVLARLKRLVVSDMDSDRGLAVGHYRMTYDDATTVDFALRLGWNIYRWDGPEIARYGYGTRWTWTGGSPAGLAQDPYARDVNVQQTEFRNPHPEKTVATLQLVSTETGAIPVLLGLTVERLREP